MRRPLTAFLLSLLLFSSALLHAAEPTDLRTLAGEIEGARWTALVPAEWNGQLLIEAPDCRRAPEPLIATIDPAAPANSELLATGWAIAITSYRRHGPLIADGIEDLRALRDRLVEELGLPKLTVVEGSGMGGLIATFIAERHADEFHGCIARDPQLALLDPRALRLRCDHQPRAPLLFLTSAEATESVEAYIARASNSANAESIVPVFWYMPADPAPEDRASLRMESLSAMGDWVRDRQAPASRTAPPPPAEPETEPAEPANNPEVPQGEPPATTPASTEEHATPTPQAPSAPTAPAPLSAE